MGNLNATVTIAQLDPLDELLLSGEDSVEITVKTRADGAPGLVKKTFRTNLNAILGIYARRRDNPNQVTAEQVGTYTVAQIQALIEERLGMIGMIVAADSQLLDGKTRQEIIEEARQGTVNDALNLGGRPAEDYLLVDQFETSIVEAATAVDAIANSLFNDEAP